MRNKNDSGMRFNSMAKLRNTVLINDDLKKYSKLITWLRGDCTKLKNKIRATTNFD